MRARRALLTLIPAVLLLAEDRAKACSCLADVDVLPRAGDVAPTNTKIWLMGMGWIYEWAEYCGTEGPLLTGPNGEVALTMAQAFSDTILLTPELELEPNSEYSFDLNCPSILYPEQPILFTTSEGPDTVAPAPVEAVEVEQVHYEPESENNAGCGPVHVGVFDVTHEGIFTLVDVHADDELDPVTLEGHVDWIGTDDYDVSVGNDTCGGGWHEATIGSHSEVRFATLDLAGNFSGWGDSQPLDFREEVADTGCGCVVIEGGRGQLGLLGLGLLGLGLGLGLRRRAF